MGALLSFQKAVEQASQDRIPHLLLGNGFSRAYRDDIFSYGSLFENADLSPRMLVLFLKRLKRPILKKSCESYGMPSEIVKLYGDNIAQISKAMLNDAKKLREILVKTIVGHHPERPSDVSREAYEACRKFLQYFKNIYTLNYDLLLYWTIMHDESGIELDCDDGFRTPEGGEEDYVSWEIENTDQQNLYYFHGALHIFDADTEIKKFTWINTVIPLITQHGYPVDYSDPLIAGWNISDKNSSQPDTHVTQIHDALNRGMFPLKVTEGTSRHKKRRILHSSFLSRAERSFASIRGNLFLYGFAMSENDDHILKLLRKGKMFGLYVGLYGNPKSSHNKHIVNTVKQLQILRPEGRPLSIHFYDAESAHVWR